MLQRTIQDTRYSGFNQLDDPSAPSGPMVRGLGLGGIARRHWMSLIMSTLLLSGLATIFVLLRSPSYVAIASVLIETRKPEIKQQSSGEVPDPAIVDSQLEILKSDQIAKSVIDGLGLADDPAFASVSMSEAIQNWAKGFTRSGDQWNEQQNSMRHIERLKKVVVARRVGVTNLLSVESRSPDPVKAAQLSNAMIEAFLQNQLNVKKSQVEKASQWLRDRSEQLGRQLRRAEREAYEYQYRSNQDRFLRIELESRAHALRNVHDSFLKRTADSAELITYITPEAQFISQALPPASQQGPSAVMIIAGGLILGLGAGLLVAYAREQLDPTLRRPSQATEALGLSNVMALPAVTSAELRRAGKQFGKRTKTYVLQYALARPRSRFGMTIRALKVAADLRARLDQCVVIGVVSSAPGEGTSTVASNLAFLTSSCAATLIVDADMKTHTITNMAMKQSPSDAPIHELARETLISQGSSECGRLAFASAESGLPEPAAELGTIICEARRRYRYIIIDLPPLLAAADGQGASPFVDCFVLVVRWGKTSRQAVADALAQAPNVAEKIVGTVLNATPQKALRRDEVYKGRAFRRFFSG